MKAFPFTNTKALCFTAGSSELPTTEAAPATRLPKGRRRGLSSFLNSRPAFPFSSSSVRTDKSIHFLFCEKYLVFLQKRDKIISGFILGQGPAGLCPVILRWIRYEFSDCDFAFLHHVRPGGQDHLRPLWPCRGV